LLLMSAAARPQERDVPAMFERAREHAVSIVQELLSHIPPDSLGRVGLKVDGAGAKVLFENALIEAFRGNGAVPVLWGNVRPDDPVVRLFILDQSRSFVPTSDGHFVRTLRTAVEGRFDRGGVPTLLGSPVRLSADTVAFAESGPLVDSEESSGVFDTVLTPFIVLGGVAVVVYLLFTVRS
jgi:hypothetical protein